MLFLLTKVQKLPKWQNNFLSLTNQKSYIVCNPAQIEFLNHFLHDNISLIFTTLTEKKKMMIISIIPKKKKNEA